MKLLCIAPKCSQCSVRPFCRITILVGAQRFADGAFVAQDVLDLRLVLLHPKLRVLLRDVLHDLGDAALALALELPAPCKLDAPSSAGLLCRLAVVLGDVDPSDRELVALVDRARGDKFQLVRARGEDRTR